MADITYTVNQDDPNSINGFEQFSQADRNLIGTFQVNNLFDTTKHFVELYITDLNGEIIEADNSYTSYKLLGNAQSAGKNGASTLTIDPIEDSKSYGYSNGGVKLLYNFLNDLYTQDKNTTEFFIVNISPDRTELQLQNLNLTNEQLVRYTSAIKDKLNSQSYFNEVRLNFGDNDLLIGINIDNLIIGENQTVVVKLYEPLPGLYGEKSTLNIVEIISDSVAFEVEAAYNLPEEPVNTLRSANFNLDISDSSVIPTGYLDYNDLFSYPVSNKNNELYSLINEKGVELSIDHTDYSDFVHFSSAYERLVNFKYKIQLIESYNTTLPLIQSATSQSVGTTGSIRYYENLITGIVNNFDHYERYLYYESSSTAWPKSNTTQPYNNRSITSSQAISWYANQLATANGYDLSNGNLLINSIPSFLRDDPNNENYLTFVHMIGQHFDNLWIYGKAVTDKYDADNRLNFGISKDLVGEALKNFGVKLYTSNNSIEDLFGSFIGQAYQSGSEKIKYYITGSLTGSNTPIQPSSYDNYNKEVQKRIYHNLSHLLKTKGTERGLRALINCFGIPSDILQIKVYGGRNVNERPYYGDYEYSTSSLDKIRLDNTGSLVSGSTLSAYTSIVKRDSKYTDDLHVIEVGFSPTDNIDNYIVSYSLATGSLSTFNIDNYIGDPGNLTLGSYEGLSAVAESILENLNQYNLQDYVRLIKFFDNTIYKSIKDYIPARALADTGIIIKPNLLNRSKAKSVAVEIIELDISASIDTAFITGSNARAFGANDDYITGYTATVQTPWGIGSVTNNQQEQPKYNGELQNSVIRITNGELNEANPYKYPSAENFVYNIQLWDIASACIFTPLPVETKYVTSSTALYLANYFFPVGTLTTTVYTASNPAGGVIYPTMPISFSGYDQYDEFYITASNGIVDASECIDIVNVVYGTCSLSLTPTGQVVQSVPPNGQVHLNTWFNIHPDQLVNYIVESPPNITNIVSGGPYSGSDDVLYTFPNAITTANVTVNDPKLGGFCSLTKTVDVDSCTLRGYRGLLTYTPSTSPQLLPEPYPNTSIGPPPNGPFIGWPPNINSLGLNRYFIGASTVYTSFAITLNPQDLESTVVTLSYDPINPGVEYWIYSIPANHNSPWIRVEAFNSPTCTAVVNIYNSTYDPTPEEQETNNTNTGPPKTYACCDLTSGDQVPCSQGSTYPCYPTPGTATP